MKFLVPLGDFAWVDPDRIDAVVDVAPGSIIILSSGEQVTLHGLSAEDVLTSISEAWLELANPSQED